MKYRLLGTDEPRAWMDALNHFPCADIYFLPQYHGAYEVSGLRTAKAFVAEDDSNMLFYPFMLGPIEIETGRSNQPWFDIETVYGYTGPLSTTADASFLAEAWRGFARVCEDMGVVAEFIRFNPLIGNVQFADDSCEVSQDRETVIMDLASGEEDVWSGCSASHRRKIRKAVSLGLECRETPFQDGIGKFKELYEKTMQMVDAAPFYFFSDAYYEFLSHALRDHVKLFLVHHKDLVLAASLFFVYGDTIHYHLGGRMVDYADVAPTPLLFHAVILWGRRNGYRWFHLGGGRTPSNDDSLFRFKASISHLRRRFYTGRRVHNREVYEKLCSDWMRRKGLTARPSYFLLYRLEDLQ